MISSELSCRKLYYVIVHPLSISSILKYQDKNGVSSNGSLNFVFENGMIQNKKKLKDLLKKGDIKRDNRNVIYYIRIVEEFQEGFGLNLLNWRGVIINFSTSTFLTNIPTLIDQERETIEHLFPYATKINKDRWEMVGEGRAEDWYGVDVCDGHVISIHSTNHWHLGSNVIPLLSSLPHLRYLAITIVSSDLPPYIYPISLIQGLVGLRMDFGSDCRVEWDFLEPLGEMTTLKALVIQQLSDTSATTSKT